MLEIAVYPLGPSLDAAQVPGRGLGKLALGACRNRIRDSSTAQHRRASRRRLGGWGMCCWLKPFDKLATTIEDRSDAVARDMLDHDSNAYVESMNGQLFLVRAGPPEVDQRAVVIGSGTARKPTEREDAGVYLKADLLPECGVIESADSPAELGAKGRQQLRAARRRRAHRCDKSRCRSLRESTPCA